MNSQAKIRVGVAGRDGCGGTTVCADAAGASLV